jgi:repressor LexA
MKPETQKETLKVINKFIKEHGYPPTVREIGSMLGVTSPATAKARIEGLVKAGKITYEPGKFRTIKVIDTEE